MELTKSRGVGLTVMRVAALNTAFASLLTIAPLGI
jgi:hypothetical protein